MYKKEYIKPIHYGLTQRSRINQKRVAGIMSEYNSIIIDLYNVMPV